MSYSIEDIPVIDEISDFKGLSVLSQIKRKELEDIYANKFGTNKVLNRSLISFQANKSEPFYRWFKYKEGFSTVFVKHMLTLFGKPDEGQVVLDPFSGIGTTVTTSIQNGFNAIGIELLSPGILATNARLSSQKISKADFEEIINQIDLINLSDSEIDKKYYFKHLSITKGAFPYETELGIANLNKFIAECPNENIKPLLIFAVTSILEDVSFTRKDGQYLRWDSRAEKKLDSKFDKGHIYSFKPKLLEKLHTINEDIKDEKPDNYAGNFELINGSCLEKLHNIASSTVDLVITSPPYCNRYDYTRTYALELAYGNVNDGEIKRLRQILLSATVENKSKYNDLRQFYIQRNKKIVFDNCVENFEKQSALNEVIENLNIQKSKLNNKNIPEMIKNYFFEMNLVINEMARTLKTNGKIVMVNDNVRYNGEEVPVDLILSEFAQSAGLNIDVIWVLEKGKGNSSQQMGEHGRTETRKCVYVWSKN